MEPMPQRLDVQGRSAATSRTLFVDCRDASLASLRANVVSESIGGGAHGADASAA